MPFLIAVDGPAASGKGTIAKAVAEHFEFLYLDTGLIYRAIARLALLTGKPVLSKKELIDIARSFKSEYLDLENLRSGEVAAYASKIAVFQEVRVELIKFQRDFVSTSKGAVLDGRDIGTKIIPHAQLKLFVTADLNIRAERRYQDLNKVDKGITFAKVLDELSKRDQQDRSRQYSPLKKAKDAHLLDTSELSIDAAIANVINLVNLTKDGL